MVRCNALKRMGSSLTRSWMRTAHLPPTRSRIWLAARANVTATRGELMDQAALTGLLPGHDAAISSVHFLASDPLKLIGAARDSKVVRYLVVGGAGSLEVAPGVRLVTTSGLPVAYKAAAAKGGRIPRPAQSRKGTELDLSVALGAVHGWRPGRQVPPWNRPAFDGSRR